VSIKFRNKFFSERIVDFKFEFDELNEITRCLAVGTHCLAIHIQGLAVRLFST